MRSKALCVIATVAAAIALFAGTAFAHHSFAAEYDRTKPVKLVGKVTMVKLSNPHAWIYIDVVTDGKTVNWALELGSGNQLIRNGWRKEDLKIGTVLHVDGSQARSGHPTANATSVTFPDGKRLFAGSSDKEAPTK